MTSDSIEEIMQRVHRLEIKAKRLASESFGGEYHSSFKGRGLDFEDFREYQHGDEPRFIDWNVTARKNTPYIRTFREERELSVILAIDISASSHYGSVHLSKRELAAEVAALLAFTAKFNGDKVGLLLFAGEPVLYLPPKKGTRHTLRMIREILAAEPSKPQTNIPAACKFLTHTVQRRSLVFMISDFMDHDLNRPIGALSHKHETIAVRIYDPVEKKLPQVGKVNLRDPETGAEVMVNTNNSNVRIAYEKLMRRQREAVDKTLKKHQIDSISLSTASDYLMPLHKFFRQRAKHRR